MKRSIAWISIALSILVGACKSVPNSNPEPAPRIQAPLVKESRLAAPSPRSPTPEELPPPSPEEDVNRRSPLSRCPTLEELEDIQKKIVKLGDETLDLVKDDVIILRQTISNPGKGAVGSCCNQLEQLVQDAEVMNEDKAGAVIDMDKIRQLTRQLCPE